MHEPRQDAADRKQDRRVMHQQNDRKHLLFRPRFHIFKKQTCLCKQRDPHIKIGSRPHKLFQPPSFRLQEAAERCESQSKSDERPHQEREGSLSGNTQAFGRKGDVPQQSDRDRLYQEAIKLQCILQRAHSFSSSSIIPRNRRSLYFLLISFFSRRLMRELVPSRNRHTFCSIQRI